MGKLPSGRPPRSGLYHVGRAVRRHAPGGLRRGGDSRRIAAVFPQRHAGPDGDLDREMSRTMRRVWVGLSRPRVGPRPWNRHPMFNPHARNKLGMTVDLSRPRGP